MCVSCFLRFIARSSSNYGYQSVCDISSGGSRYLLALRGFFTPCNRNIPIVDTLHTVETSLRRAMFLGLTDGPFPTWKGKELISESTSRKEVSNAVLPSDIGERLAPRALCISTQHYTNASISVTRQSFIVRLPEPRILSVSYSLRNVSLIQHGIRPPHLQRSTL